MTAISQKSNKYAAGIIGILLLLFLISLIGSTWFLDFLGLSAINASVFFTSRMLYWLCLGLLWLYSVKIEKQDLLIWKERNYNILNYLLSIVVIFFVLMAGMLLIQGILAFTGFSKQSKTLNQIAIILKANKPLLVFTALTAGVVEEFIMRGYIQPRLEIIFKNSYAAIIISSLLFGLLHYKYGTFVNVAGPVFIGFVFAFYYWRYRNIKVLIVCHFLWDVASLLLIKVH
ncbi:MAG TPA: CPBP family intramembrane glutamic endopeptidase [Ginsengibacter sp.]